ncbi:hypothetical protein [Rhizobium leguminosarum]
MAAMGLDTVNPRGAAAMAARGLIPMLDRAQGRLFAFDRAEARLFGIDLSRPDAFQRYLALVYLVECCFSKLKAVSTHRHTI